MSDFEGTPAAIVAALSAITPVDGQVTINGFELKPKTPRPGDAWVTWVGAERGADGYLIDTWRVTIRMPDDEARQRTFQAAYRWPLIDALKGVIFIDTFEAGTSNDAPVLLINGRE